MQAYFRNHQLYLAEKSEWLDRHVVKASKRALLKIESWKIITRGCDQDQHYKMIENLLKDSLLTPISNRKVLHQEGFYHYNLEN